MRRTRIFPAARLLSATVAVAVMGGCATKGDIRSLQTELRAVAMRQDSLLAQLRRETRSTQDTLRTTTDQLFSFRGDIASQLRDLSQVMTRIEAMVGENQRGIGQVRDQLANLRRPTPAPSNDPGASSIGGGGGEAEGLYSAGMRQLSRGSLGTARRAFEALLNSHPNHALAPDARFRLADIEEREGRLEEALGAFLEIQTLTPTAAIVPDALYRAALVQIALGREDDAVRTLERVINTYPDAEIASLARAELADLR